MIQLLLLAGVLLCIAMAVRERVAVAPLADGLNWWVINVALPAMIFELVPALRFQPGMWFVVVPQWVLAVLSALAFRWIGTRLGWQRGRIAAITLLAGASNTAFLGYPMLESLRGSDAVRLGVVADQLGCFLALAIGGAWVVSVYCDVGARPRRLVTQILLFPPFAALLIAVLAGACGGWPSVLLPVFHRLGQTLAPLALFTVGLRLKLRPARGHAGIVALTIGWKLLLFPLVTLLAGRMFGVSGLIYTVGVLQTAMAPMFTAAIIARQNGFDTDLVDASLSLGVLLSFVTVPAWSLILP